MSRTYRRLPWRHMRWFRGRKAALQRGDRRPPPNPWDDYPYSAESMFPWTLSYRMASDGKSIEEITAVLRRRGLSWRRATEVARHAVSRRRGSW